MPPSKHTFSTVFCLLASLTLLAAASSAALAQSYGIARDTPTTPTQELAELSADQVAAIMAAEAGAISAEAAGVQNRGKKRRANPLSAKVMACTEAGKAGLKAWTQASALADSRGGGYPDTKTGDKFSFKASFANGSAQISAADMADLAKLAAGMKQADLAAFQFLIEGHANKTGTAAQNYNISCQRAINMRTVLIERYGVPASRIDVVGLGFDELIPDRDETDAAHRRAEFRYRRP